MFELFDVSNMTSQHVWRQYKTDGSEAIKLATAVTLHGAKSAAAARAGVAKKPLADVDVWSGATGRCTSSPSIS
jgi:hypothetical protein